MIRGTVTNATRAILQIGSKSFHVGVLPREAGLRINFIGPDNLTLRVGMGVKIDGVAHTILHWSLDNGIHEIFAREVTA